MRATKKRAVWMPNLHSVKVTYQGVRQTMRLCSKCVRRVKANMPVYHSKPVEAEKIPVKLAPKQSKIPVPVATA